MASKVENSDKNELKNPFKENYLQTYVSDFYKRWPNLKTQICRPPQQNSELKSELYARHIYVNPAASGGDTDGVLNHSMYSARHVDDYYRIHSKYENGSGDHNYPFENDSRSVGNNSEGSAKSQKSSKTVVSRKSCQDLKKLVTSQCKLQEEIEETLKRMCNTKDGDVHNSLVNEEAPPASSTSQCKRCSDRLNSKWSQTDVTTEIRKDDILDCQNTNTLTISVDDVINSRVINPMIHKLHRMYLNNLRQEMSLMEDLEQMPNKINEVYKHIIIKKKD